MENITFDKEELVYILKGLYSQQQSYGGGYRHITNHITYQHFKNVRLIIEKIEKENKENE